MNRLQYFDLIQCIPAEFNAQQKIKIAGYEDLYGKGSFNDIRYGKKHHELKATRSEDYSLTTSELDNLKENGIIFKETTKSFPQLYLDLYNNDMPVFVTSDSMLFALHKFYDTWLKNVEKTNLIKKLSLLCQSILDELYTITPTPENSMYLQHLEVYFMVPLVIMSLNNELSETINETQVKLYTDSEFANMIDNGNDSRQYFGDVDNIDKLQLLFKFYNYPNKCTWTYASTVERDEKLFNLYNQFKIPDTNEPINFKFGGKALFDSMIKNIATFQDIELNLCDVKIKMMGSLFKPRGHYTESLELKKYFMAFTWLSTLEINVDHKEESIKSLLLGAIVAKISEKYLVAINELQDFISLIIGKSDGYTLGSFLELINKYIPSCKSLDETISWLLENNTLLWKNVMNGPYQKPVLGKFGDIDGDDKHELSFSLFGCGTQIDNTIISQFVDNNLVEENGNILKRKFLSIYDLCYTLFGNKSVKNKINDLMNNVNVKQRDGYQYTNHLEAIAKQCDEHVFDKTLYAQELKMLRTLVTDKLDISPFNLPSWNEKQAITQIAHYAELRHDNCLYVKEVCGMMCLCQYPDLLVEPVPTFWKEMLTFVNMMKCMVEKDSRDEQILNNFVDIIETFIAYLDLYVNNKIIDDDIMEKLKLIIASYIEGSGSDIGYSGWYGNLFHDVEQEMNPKPEVSSFFTGVNDDRGPGGIIHIGTGPCKLMYLLVNDPNTNERKIMMGPTYSAYTCMMDYGVRLNDDEWRKTYQKYQSL